MPTPPIAFVQKMDRLCERVKMTRGRMKQGLIDKYDLHRSRVNMWFGPNPPGLSEKYMEQFSLYWLNEHRIEFLPRHYICSFEEFSIDFPAPRGFRPTMKLAPFVGCYQIIRPHSSSKDRYALEALSITSEAGSMVNLMYPHTTKKDPDYVYRGDIKIANRYYFSLLERVHEDPEFEQAYRSITFYIGDGAIPECLSGIMLRGVTGRGGSSMQAVGMPFIAIRVRKDADFLKPDFVKTKNNRVSRLHDGGHILVGELTKTASPGLFGFCDGLFNSIKTMSRGLFDGNQLVLHTLIPVEISELPEARFADWKAAIAHEM